MDNAKEKNINLPEAEVALKTILRIYLDEIEAIKKEAGSHENSHEK